MNSYLQKSFNKRRVSQTFIIAVFLIVAFFATAMAQQIAFPTAEGYGKYSQGGRGGSVIEVTRLDDDNNPGTLRYAINQFGPRTVVFRISGTIILNSTLTVSNPYITIAGQTAPGDGICLRRYPFNIAASHTIVRYLRVRLGDETGGEGDAMGGKSTGARNIIIDHCSVSWSEDEGLSPYDNDSLTVQWCLVSESLYNSNHSKGAHGYGGIWGGNENTYHHNLLAHNSSRNPRFASAVGLNDYRNNVVYNWGYYSTYGGEHYVDGLNPVEGEFFNVNIVGNYYKAGPATGSSVRYMICGPSSRNGSIDAGKWYVTGNYIDGSPSITADNWSGGVMASAAPLDSFKAVVPFNTMPIQEQIPEDAYQSVLQDVGASLPRRDVVDLRIIDNVQNGNATYEGATYELNHSVPDPSQICGMIDSQTDVGGWPQLFTAPVPLDSDQDGMPDAWEISHGLNPLDPEDRNTIGAGGYTQLEIYLNSITTQPDFLYPPTNLNVVLTNTNEVTLTWQDNSSQETGFILERAIGTGSFVVIDTLIANTVTKIDSNLLDTTSYTYRLSCYNDTSNSWYSNSAQIVTMSATLPPPVVTTPVPGDNELYVNQNIILRWRQGLNTLSYNVYFDTTNPPPFVGNVSATKFTPPAIEKGTTYYWRVNAVNANGATEGPVWSFTSKTDLPPQMVARWSFDEDSGSVVQDIGPFINPGSFTSFTQNPRVVGYLGGAINFNGQQGYIRVPHNGSIDFGKESFSVSYWLKVGTLSGVSMYIVHKGSTVRDTVTGTSGKWFGFEIKNNQMRWNVDDDVVKTTASILTIDTLLKTQWNHIVGLRDSTTKQMRLYVNGVLRSTQVDATGDISENEDLTIGSTTAATAILAGTVDDLRFYNYALSDGEIQTLANQPSTGIGNRSIVPTQFALEQNYPNPFNPTTVISYQLSASSSVDLRVYDILGREVASLVHGMQVAGKYTVSFDASRLSSGLYIYRLVAGQFSVSRKMLLMK